TDTDKIVAFETGPQAGKYSGRIDLESDPSQPRAFAQALLFGPGATLFVPISGGDSSTTGSVRRYDVRNNLSQSSFTIFTAPAGAGGPIGAGWYLTFGKTNPGTLAYTE